MGRTIAVGSEAFGNGDFTPIPINEKLRVSVYDIDIVEVKSGPNAGKEQFDVTVKVTEDGAFKGREIRYNKIPLYDGKGAWALVAFAEAVGWKTEKGAGVEIPDEYKSVVGTEFIAKIGQTNSTKINEATGQPYVNNRVTGFSKLRGGGGQPATEAKPTWGSL